MLLVRPHVTMTNGLLSNSVSYCTENVRDEYKYSAIFTHLVICTAQKLFYRLAMMTSKCYREKSCEKPVTLSRKKVFVSRNSLFTIQVG